jgi:DNA helicase-2/ATP-dependent DNA helicase PcrA
MSHAPASRADVEHIFTDITFSQDFRVREEALEKLERRIREAPVDTREALASFRAIADQYQQQVIESTQSMIRLVAPAGSGKTQTVVNRVLHRIKNGLNPERILVLTFDNAAASSLHATVERTIGKPIDGLRISTLNAYGYFVLREYFPAEYKRIIPEYRPRYLLRDALEALKRISPERRAALPPNVEDRFYLEFFSLLKNSLFDPRNVDAQHIADFMLERPQAEPFFTDPSDGKSVEMAIQAVIWLFKAYEKAIQQENAIDFDDQKLRAYVLLNDNHGVLRAIQGRLSEVVVDEFQDINLLDFAFIKTLSDRAGLVVVGDDDQAIYGFRGCTPDFIIDLEKHSERKVSSFELQVNYRCPPNIVDHADKLIRHNTRRIPKNPIAHGRTPSQIKVASTLSASLEAKFIVSFVKRVRKANPILDFNNFAVLYRTNAQSLPLQIQFVLSDIPYFVRERDNILSNEMLERLLGVLRVKLAVEGGQIPTSRDALLVLKAYFRHIDADEAERLEKLFSRQESFFDSISSEQFHRILPFARESSILPVMQQVAKARTLMDTLDILTRRFRGLRGMIGSLEDVLGDRVPLGEVYDLAVDFKGDTGDFVRTLDRALDRAKAVEAGKQEESGVRLLTYFKSKGLQWHTVILTTCNEGLIPHKRAPIEDERRLFYVALTRSSANLLISYVKNVCGTQVPPSRFLKEAGLI